MLRPEPEAAFAEATQNPLFFPSHLVLVTRFLRISITLASPAKTAWRGPCASTARDKRLCLVKAQVKHHIPKPHPFETERPLEDRPT